MWWVENVLGDALWWKQVEVLESLRDHPRTAVRSAHGSGKSYCAARAILWFLLSHPDSIVAVTAPTVRQVRNIIFQEIRRAHKNSRVPLGGEVLQQEVRLDAGWFGIGFSTEDPDAVQGLHAEHILVVLDEAAGIPRKVWTAVEGLLTSSGARLLAIGNPTDPTSAFADEFRSPWTNKIHISAFDIPNVARGHEVVPGLTSRAWVENKKEKWGETSPAYQARVLGEFPDLGSDCLVPLAWLEAARDRDLDPGEPVILGVDVARFGEDETVLALREGDRVRIVKTLKGSDTMRVVGEVALAIRTYKPEYAYVDVVGIGAGVVDRLLEQGLPVEGVHGGGRASDPERFAMARDEWYWSLRDRFEHGAIDLDEDEELIGQLASLRVYPDSKARMRLWPKERMRRHGLLSPDRADAVAIAMIENVAPELVLV